MEVLLLMWHSIIGVLGLAFGAVYLMRALDILLSFREAPKYLLWTKAKKRAVWLRLVGQFSLSVITFSIGVFIAWRFWT